MRSARCSRPSSRACAATTRACGCCSTTPAKPASSPATSCAPRPPSHVSTSGSHHLPTEPPDIVREFPLAAIERFGDPELVSTGCRVPARGAGAGRGRDASPAAVFVDDAMTHGDRHALEGAVASCWWCALRSARLRDVDPIAEAAAHLPIRRARRLNVARRPYDHQAVWSTGAVVDWLPTRRRWLCWWRASACVGCVQ